MKPLTRHEMVRGGIPTENTNSFLWMTACLPPPNGSFVVHGSPAHTFSLFLSIAFPLYVAACVSVFLYFHKSTALLRHRRTLHIGIGAVACIFALAYTAIFDYVGPERFPCVLLLMLIHLGGLALGTVPLIMKMVLYINQISTLRVGRQVQLSTLKSSTHTLQSENSFRFSHSPHTSSLGISPVHTNNNSSAPYALQPAATWETFSTYIRFIMYPKSRKSASVHERTLNLQFMKSHAYIAMWIFMAFLIGIITCVVRIATDPQLQNNCSGCVVTKMDAVSNLVMAVWGQLAGPCTVPTRLVDRLGILHEFRMCFYSSAFTVLGLALYLIDPFGDDATFNWLNLSLIQFAFCIYFSTVHQVFLSRRSVNGLKNFNAEECYLEVLQDRNLKSMLRKHLDEELNSEVYWFLDAVEAYTSSPEGKNIKAKAEVLFREFIQLGAIYEVNLSSHARSAVTKRITDADIDLHMFDECAYEVKSSLLNDGFLRFLRNLDVEKKKAMVAFQE